jgi:hypothetical protein
LEDGSAVEADIYLWQDSLRSQLHGKWDPEGFRELHLESYTQMCREFAAELAYSGKR